MGLSKLDTPNARAHLKLRRRPDRAWEVYATIHGTLTFRWWIISDSQRDWYKQHFPEIKEVPYV